MEQHLLLGDSADRLKELKDNSIDLLATDPSYGLHFMGKDWDKALPDTEIFRECYRVLKPGSFIAVMSSPRSDLLYRMIQKLEDAGFDMSFSPILWTYHSGFPKASDTSKMIDKRLGAEREVVGLDPNSIGREMEENIKLMNGDCLELMKTIPNGSVDLICCDLPYGTTDRYGGKKTNSNRFMNWDNIIPLDKLWEEYKRILKPNGVVCLTADQPFTSQLVMSNLDWFKYEFIWKKNITTGFLLANYRPMKQTEDVLVFSEGGASAASAKAGNNMTYNPQGLEPKVVVRKNGKKRLGKFLSNEEFLGKNNSLLGDKEYSQKFTNYPKEIIEFSMDTETVHPTQKPVALMEYLIKTYSNEGEIVLDNAMGSGSTGVACINTNRKFIGIELNEDYFNSAKDRIENIIK